MAGFGRNEAVDKPGFQGTIPDNTTIPVVLIENNKVGTKIHKLKNGQNAGRTATIFKPVFECVKGKYEGGRVYADIWCNVEIDPTSGEAVVFGSHALFCDLCDATDVHDDDGGYPMAANEAEGNSIIGRMFGKAMWITVGVRDYEKPDGSTAYVNTLKQITPMTEDQTKVIEEKIAPLMERIAVQRAKREAKAGGSGLEGFGPPAGATSSDLDLPF